MNRQIATCILISLTGFSHADTRDDALSLMKEYLSTVTCEEYNDDESLRIWEIESNDGNPEAFGVLWSGDKSCGGGSGAGNVYITPVLATPRGNLVVANEGELKISGKEIKAAGLVGDLIMIQVPEYKDDDPNCCPSGSAMHFVGFDGIGKKFSIKNTVSD